MGGCISKDAIEGVPAEGLNVKWSSDRIQSGCVDVIRERIVQRPQVPEACLDLARAQQAVFDRCLKIALRDGDVRRRLVKLQLEVNTSRMFVMDGMNECVNTETIRDALRKYPRIVSDVVSDEVRFSVMGFDDVQTEQEAKAELKADLSTFQLLHPEMTQDFLNAMVDRMRVSWLEWNCDPPFWGMVGVRGDELFVSKHAKKLVNGVAAAVVVKEVIKHEGRHGIERAWLEEAGGCDTAIIGCFSARDNILQRIGGKALDAGYYGASKAAERLFGQDRKVFKSRFVRVTPFGLVIPAEIGFM
jgi:hypothetical protein